MIDPILALRRLRDITDEMRTHGSISNWQTDVRLRDGINVATEALKSLGTVHHLKAWPEYFVEMADWSKRFEVRKDDRGFKAGDVLILQEYKPSPEERALAGLKDDENLIQAQSISSYPQQFGFTGRMILRRVRYIMRGPVFGLAEGWVVMSLAGL